MNKTGIYKITNKINGKYYVGSSSYINQRWSTHRKLLNKNKHYNPHLQNAWEKYGKESFDFIVIEEIEILHLLKREQKGERKSHKGWILH